MTGPDQFLFFFSALGAFNGFLLSIYFAIHAKKKIFTNYFLSLLLLVLSIRVIKSVFFYFTPQLSNSFIQIGLSACILIGPFLFLYLKAYAEDKKNNWANHVLPYLIGISILGLLYPYVEHTFIWRKRIIKTIYVQWFIYIILSAKYLRPIFKKIKIFDFWRYLLMSYLLSSKIRTLSSRFIGFFLLIIVALSLSKWHFHASLIGYFLWLMGWLFVGVGAMGRIWCSIYISGYKNNKLVMEGPYSLCRNPLYLFSYLGGVGIMFLTETFLFPLIFTVYFLIYYHYVISQEEKFLSKKYGMKYLAYMDRIPRFIPSFKKYTEPECYQISPKHFRIFLVQVVWFFWIAALVQLFEKLRLLGVIPSIFRWF